MLLYECFLCLSRSLAHFISLLLSGIFCDFGPFRGHSACPDPWHISLAYYWVVFFVTFALLEDTTLHVIKQGCAVSFGFIFSTNGKFQKHCILMQGVIIMQGVINYSIVFDSLMSVGWCMAEIVKLANFIIM